MNVTLSMFSTIFFLPSAKRLFTFSRSAFDSSPRTMRPSRATTDTPSTSRFVIFNATFVSSSFFGKPHSGKKSGGNQFRSRTAYQSSREPPLSRSLLGAAIAFGDQSLVTAHESLNVIRAGHVVAAQIADQLAPARFQPLRAHGTIARSVLSPQPGRSRLRKCHLGRAQLTLCPSGTQRQAGLLRSLFHGG